MNEFLGQILETSRRRVRDLGVVPLCGACERPSFIDALRGKEKLSVIAEFKRRSPTLGPIGESVDLAAQIGGYQDRGAAAVSVLTEPSRFGGSYVDLERAAQTVPLPLLMKDFVVDEQQLRAGVAAGASAALLIVRCLTPTRLRELASECSELGMTVLIECGDEEELEMALSVEYESAKDVVIGVNNRDLGSLKVDMGRALRLLPMIPSNRVAIAESGYSRRDDIVALDGLADAVLIGTTFMRGAEAGFEAMGVGG